MSVPPKPPPEVMRLVSWNVAARTRRLREQASALAGLSPQVVCLQEVTASTRLAWAVALAEAGLPHALSSIELSATPELLVGARRLGELVASTFPLEPLAPDPRLPWPERLLSVTVRRPAPRGTFELHTAYIPPGSVHDWLKIETLEGIFARLAGTANGVPRVLCGDFNTPRAESVDGTVLTWGQTETGRTRSRLGERWDAGERNILVRLADFDLADAFRSVHGYAVQAYSYRTNNRGRRTPRRFDHAFASASLAPVAARYVNAFADAWLSDHAPLIVDFAG